MAEKAILVTKANIDKLNKRFQNDGTGVPMAIGYFLVAGFGEDGSYELLSAATFNQRYTQGQPIRNGFFEAVPR